MGAAIVAAPPYLPSKNFFYHLTCQTGWVFAGELRYDCREVCALGFARGTVVVTGKQIIERCADGRYLCEVRDELGHDFTISNEIG